MMRLIVCAAELVCSVRERQVPGLGDAQRRLDRLEVAHLADEHDVGVLAQRRAQRRARSPCVSLCTSRWLTRQPLCGWMYSIGSSMVRMCSRRSVLILSIIAASVVDLPLPVGPGDEDQAARPLGQRGETAGSPSSWKPGSAPGISR